MNKMKTEKYTAQKNRLPQTGKQVIAQTDGENMIVYQAFNPRITDYAVAHQQFGGPDYSFSRMSWIKPGFLWMMYRAGWAAKEDQQRILAITVPITHFKTILQQATLSSFDSQLYVLKPIGSRLWQLPKCACNGIRIMTLLAISRNEKRFKLG
jgi:hypothetical protein